MHPLAPAALLLAAFAPPAAETPAAAQADGVVTIQSAADQAAAAAEPVWQNDLKSAFARSAKEGKPVLVLFGAEWCHYCHKQDDETLTDAAVKKALADGFVPVRLDVDDHQRIAKILEVSTLPQAVILAPNADLLGRAKGYHTPTQFGTALSKATAKHAARTARLAAAPTKSATL